MSFEVGKSFGGGRTESSGGDKREFQVSGAGSRGRLGRRFKNAEAYNPKIAVDRGLYLLVPKKTRSSWKSIFHGTIRISFCFVPPARPGECRYPADGAAVTGAGTAVTAVGDAPWSP